MKHTVDITKYITTQDIENVLSCESGGFDYWAVLDMQDDIYNKHSKQLSKEKKDANVCYEEVLAHILESGESIKVFDFEENKNYELTLEKLLNGFRLNAIYRPHDSCIEGGDAITADCILQYAIFGGIIYG